MIIGRDAENLFKAADDVDRIDGKLDVDRGGESITHAAGVAPRGTHRQKFFAFEQNYFCGIPLGKMIGDARAPYIRRQ